MFTQFFDRWIYTILALTLLIAVVFVIRLNSHLSGDSAWYLYLGSQLLRGGQLYRDFIEVNPPLGIWTLLPIVWVAENTGSNVINIFTAAVLCLALLSLGLVARLLQLHSSLPPGFVRLTTILMAIPMLITAEFDFAQREHLMIMLVMPWLVLRWLRLEGHNPSKVMAVSIGLMAALGFWQKPHALLIPLMVELYMLWKHRTLNVLFTSENLTALLVTTLYIVAVLVFAPEFFSLILRLGISAYLPFYGYDWATILLRSLSLALVMFLPFIALRFATPPLKSLLELLAITALAFLVCYLVQWKGYFYQLLPARIALLMTLAVTICGFTWRLIPRERTTRSVPIAMSLGFTCLTISQLFTPVPENLKIVRDLINTHVPTANSIFIASTNVNAAFPTVLEGNLKWASRYPAQWLAPYAATKLSSAGQPTDEISRYALTSVIDDLLRFKPDAIVVNENAKQDYFREAPLDFIKFWQNDPRFESIWVDYKRVEQVDGYSVWKRNNVGIWEAQGRPDQDTQQAAE